MRVEEGRDSLHAFHDLGHHLWGEGILQDILKRAFEVVVGEIVKIVAHVRLVMLSRSVAAVFVVS